MKSGPKEPDDVVHHPGVSPAATPDVRAVVRRIEDLLADLVEIAAEGSVPAEESEELWRDDEAVYIEAKLPRGAGGHVDVSIFGKKLFIPHGDLKPRAPDPAAEAGPPRHGGAIGGSAPGSPALGGA